MRVWSRTVALSSSPFSGVISFQPSNVIALRDETWNIISCPSRLNIRTSVTGSSTGRPVIRAISFAPASFNGCRRRRVRISEAILGSCPACSRAKNSRWLGTPDLTNIRSAIASSIRMKGFDQRGRIAVGIEHAVRVAHDGLEMQPRLVGEMLGAGPVHTPSLFSK